MGPLVAWAALVGLLAGVLAWNERSNRRELEQRFVLWGAIAASFAEAYVDDLVGREREQARDCLALAGQVAVSRAVLTATRRRPVVAFAVPYETPYGRRVFSGAYEIASTPLADYLGNAVPIASATLYLVDPGGVVVASNRQLPEGLAGLGTLDPALAASLARRPAGGWSAT
jgi:hypothetical protein